MGHPAVSDESMGSHLSSMISPAFLQLAAESERNCSAFSSPTFSDTLDLLFLLCNQHPAVMQGVEQTHPLPTHP